MKFFIAILAVAHAAKDAHNAGPRERPAQLVKIETQQDWCLDSDWVDNWDDGCDWYDANPSGCGGYDEGTGGSAWDECCACGGGTTCTDEWVDSYGDGCDWYWGNEDGCGWYDTDCGSA